MTRNARDVTFASVAGRKILERGLRITRGGRKLRKYLRATGVNSGAFARKAGVSRVTLYQVIKGERWKFITVDFALKVSIASDGLTKVEDFASITATPANEEDDDARRRRSTGTDG